jgi:S1-C subfamily serine protease
MITAMQFLLRQILGVALFVLVILGLSAAPSLVKKAGEPIAYDTLSGTTTEKKSEIPLQKTKPTSIEATPIKTSPEEEKKVSTPVISSEPPKAGTASSSSLSLQSGTNISDLNTKVRQSLVNILCTTNVPPFKAITATGVIIDPRGVILTNAHVAEYYLLKDYAGPNSIDCVIRTGSPASPSYQGELLFISPKWVEDNKNSIKEETPLGTGENDFALIFITKKIDSTLSTGTFPFLPLGTSDSDIDQKMEIDHVIAGYPAGFLGATEIERGLYIASAVGRIKQIFTFKETTVDLVSLGGSVVAQKGASGGAVVSSENGKLVGIIVTTTNAETTGERDLRAITLSHIERSMKETTGVGIKEYLSGDLDRTISLFNNTLYPYLSGILKSVLIQ